ncbi:MAG: GntR family transcriptional regulator, partial [Methanobacteriota archaeon]
MMNESLFTSEVTLAQKAYEIIEEMIVTLQLPPGTMFSEKQLSERIGIGRTPLREALQKLATQKLITMLPRRGVVVSDINVSQMLALLETRRVLDRLIAGKAALRATPLQKKRLQEIASAIQTAVQQNDISTYMKLDREFDHLLEEACRNPFAAQLAATLHVHCRRFWFYYHSPDELQKAARLHLDVMEAVITGDGERAESASD